MLLQSIILETFQQMVLIIQLLNLRIAKDGCTESTKLDCDVNQRMPLLPNNHLFWVFLWNGTDYTTTQAGTRIAKDGCTADHFELDCYPSGCHVTTQTMDSLYWTQES
jgi:hypothetical protein